MVESQPSKLLVAGSIPVSRSSLRPRVHRGGYGWQASQGEGWSAVAPVVAAPLGAAPKADLSAEALKARRPM